MEKKCPVVIPDPESARTPKEKVGLHNARIFLIYAEEGVNKKKLPLFRGSFNRKLAADIVGFGRSAYDQNKYIGDIASWIDKQLGGIKQKTSYPVVQGKMDREMVREIARLQSRIFVLTVALDEANVRLSTVGYIVDTLENGSVRLPW